MMTRHGKNAGFSLLELLLVLGVISTLMMGLINVFDGWSERAINRKTAVDILRLQSAASRYVTTNYSSFLSDATGTFIEIPIADIANGVYLPTGFVTRNPFRQITRVYRRKLEVPQLNADGSQTVNLDGVPVRTVVFEVLTITDNPSPALTVRIPNARLMDIVQAGGSKMGVHSQISIPGATYTGRITNPLNEWYLTYSTGTLPGYTATPDARGGYLAAYEIVSTANLRENENYLYRVEIPGRPELNQMRTNLLMNGQPIRETGNLTADRVEVVGDAAFLGQGGGAGDNTQALTLDQALRVNGAGESRIDMKTGTSGCGFVDVGNNRDITGSGCAVTGGEMQVISAGTARLDIPGVLRADGSVITDNTNIAGITEAYGTSTFNTVTGDNMNASERVVAPEVYVLGNIVNARQLQAGNVGLYDTSGAGGLTSYGGLTAARVSPTGSFNVTTQRLDIGNVAQFNQNLITGTSNVTHSLDMVTIDATAAAPLNMRDTVLNRNVRCTYKAANGKTYCEPVGIGLHYWSGRWYEQDCVIQANGYRCNDWRRNAANTARETWLGECTYTRDNNASGAATHSSPTCTFP